MRHSLLCAAAVLLMSLRCFGALAEGPFFDSSSHRRSANTVLTTGTATLWNTSTSLDTSSKQCLGFLVGISTESGAVQAWHFLHDAFPHLSVSNVPDLGFWDQHDGKYKECLLGDYLVLLQGNSSTGRHAVQGQAEATVVTCGSGSNQIFTNSSRFLRSQHCHELQDRQVPEPSSDNLLQTPTADKQASTTQRSAAKDSSYASSMGRFQKHHLDDAGFPSEPWWWSTRWFGSWHAGKAATSTSFGRQVKALQHSSARGPTQPDTINSPSYYVDISSSYLYTATAPHRLQQQLPEAHILVILTEPVTHVITQFNKLWLQQYADTVDDPVNPSLQVVPVGQQQRQKWRQTLTMNLTQQMQQLAACQTARQMQLDSEAISTCRKPLAMSDIDSPERASMLQQPTWQFVKQGMYADSLAVWLDCFPADQVRIWTSEGLAADPASHIQQLADWLGLKSSGFDPDTMSKRQEQLQLDADAKLQLVAQPPLDVLQSLQQFYSDQNERLFRLLEQKGFLDAVAQMKRLWTSTPQWTTLGDYAQVPASLALPSSAYLTPKPTFHVAIDIDPDQVLLKIPQSFMGISHEWPFVETINSIPGYKDMLNLLSSYGTGPFNIRVGGGSTDKQDMVPSSTVFEALRQVHLETGAEYILGLNFQQQNVSLARAQWEAAKQQLPAEALVTFEIGNEPNYYEGMEGGKTALEWVRCCLVQTWATFAEALSCPCGSLWCCSSNTFAGPVWGHINVYPTTLRWFLEQAHHYVNLTTIHWYKATKEVHNTPASLLDEAPIRREMANLKQLVEVSNSFGKPLRMAEANTISNSGKEGVSNVFAAALWTLDAFFEIAAAGAVGVNLHQGAGQNHYAALIRYYQADNTTLAPVAIRPAFYGMLLFQQAVRNSSYLLQQHRVSPRNSTFSSHLKLWPLLDVNTQQLRSVVINKHASRAGIQHICLHKPWVQKYPARAKVTRLLAKGAEPLSAKGGISLAGRVFGSGGLLMGKEQHSWVFSRHVHGRSCWEVYMPPGSAALIESDQEAAQ